MPTWATAGPTSIKSGELHVITEDQTWINEVGRRLGLGDDALRTHPMRHVLTMAIGVSDSLRIHSYAVPLEPGAQFLLCSDGLHGVVTAEQIVETLSRRRNARRQMPHADRRGQAGGRPG